ncbi:DUF262 domain-containing protein [bacterium LRH843]|nr:DUF262 domain-containing protein [bacterium LRH843]
MVLNNENNEFEFYGEESEEDLLIENIEVFNQAVIWGTDWTTETVVSQLKKGNIDLDPKFQRRDAWNDLEKSKLIESLILGLPVPPIILAEKKTKKNEYLVIDGKQRLLTLRQFCADIDDKFNILTLKKMQYLKSLNGITYQDLQDNIEFSQFRTNFENQIIRTIVIKNWPNEKFLYSVFLRLNTGSKKLSPQELRQALHPGDFLDFLDERTASSQLFFKLLRNNEPDPRMRDVELALRYFAFKTNINSFKGNLKEFLDNTSQKLNEAWEDKKEDITGEFDELEKAINYVFEMFGEKEAFSRWDKGRFSSRFNRALYEVFTFYFSIPLVREILDHKKEDFVNLFKELSENDNEFNDAISSTTKDIHKTVYRFNKIYQLINNLIVIDIPYLALKEGYIESVY